MVIESTSDYWKPFYYLLDDALEVTGVSGRAMLEALIAGERDPASDRRPGPAPDAVEDTGFDRGADRTIQ